MGGRGMRAVFSIPGKPFAKRRAKGFYNKALGRSVTVNDPENRSFEVTVAYYAGQVIKAPIEGPVRLTVIAIFEIPKTWPKYRRLAAPGTLHTSKPDGDNCLKAIKDGMNRVAWRDDSQVGDSRIVKIWGDRDETIVEFGPAPAAFSTWQQNDCWESPCTSWFDRLRWLLKVMDADDLALPVVAKLFWDLSQGGGLSEKQVQLAEYTIDRVTKARGCPSLDAPKGGA